MSWTTGSLESWGPHFPSIWYRSFTVCLLPTLGEWHHICKPKCLCPTHPLSYLLEQIFSRSAYHKPPKLLIPSPFSLGPCFPWHSGALSASIPADLDLGYCGGWFWSPTWLDWDVPRFMRHIPGRANERVSRHDGITSTQSSSIVWTGYWEWVKLRARGDWRKHVIFSCFYSTLHPVFRMWTVLPHPTSMRLQALKS